jgi:hypothetical protein
MKLRELEIGKNFLFVKPGVCTEIYKKKKAFNSEFCIVGLPDVYDEFAASLDAEIIAEDNERKEE